jgi:dTMP kinase
MSQPHSYIDLIEIDIYITAIMKRGHFIVLDGLDGCGKSTQIKLLTAYLKKLKKPVLSLREPGGTLISEQIRKILLNPVHKNMSVKTELLLYMASRAQLAQEIIKPALQRGQTVVCDRFLSSSIAYQGWAGKLGTKTVTDMGHWAIDALHPDLTIILDIKPEDGLKRIKKFDRMESKVISFHRRVRQGFLAMARLDPKHFKVIAGYKTIPEIHSAIKTIVGKRFKL